VGSGR